MKAVRPPLESPAPLPLADGLFAAHAAATADDATAMVKKGVAFIKANGADKGMPRSAARTASSRRTTCTSWSTAWTARCAPTAPTKR